MGKHFVTVCVFCLLCATHSPCSSHVTLTPTPKSPDTPNPSALAVPDLRTDDPRITDRFSPTAPKTRDNRTADERVFVERILETFGDGETIGYEGFVRMMKTLGLEGVLGKGNGTERQTKGCLDPKDLIRSVSQPNATNATKAFDADSLRLVCPVLLYQLVVPVAEREGCAVADAGTSTSRSEVDEASRGDANFHLHAVHYVNNSNMTSVWIYSTLSIIIISACGLLGVLVIPIMQQHFYQHLIQFLVALAVGTLAGDALLHLLPHAMMNPSHDHSSSNHLPNTHDEFDDEHSRNMWRGFVAMVGVIFFFFMEKCLTLGAEWRHQRQLRKNKVPTRVRVMRETDTVSNTSVGCKHKYSSYPYCYGMIATETQDDHHKPHNHNSNSNLNELHNHTNATVLNEIDSDSEYLSSKHIHLPETNQNMSKCTGDSRNMKCSESNKMLAEHADTHTLQDFNAIKPQDAESYTVILRTHENKHHGHSHTHGHVHSPPNTLSSVAWMVVMGDGLHNFTDGMAIGAAFAGSLAGGFSTAVAVFCHELPHEIGDFAVLLKAGMTARQAIFYNLLSSILCIFGMILGVCLGNNGTASSWLFSVAAGMFLYIALVDMIPELTTNHSEEGGSLLQCVLQFLGLMTGLSIMLVIALYEHDLKQLFHE